MSNTVPPAVLDRVSDAAGVHYRYVIPICLVATLGGLLFGYDTIVISGVIEPLTAHFHLSDSMKGFASGCVLLGCATGVLVVGPLSDRFGRKLAMFLAAAMFLVSAIGTSLPHDIWTFVAFRFIGGLGVGFASISTPMYIAEVTPAAIRGRLVAVNQIAIATGAVASAFMNYAITRLHGDVAGPALQVWMAESGWRWMFAAGILPAIVFGLLLLPIPESPRWLVEKKRSEKAKAILTKVAGSSFAGTEFASIQTSLNQERGNWSELLAPRMRLPLFVGIALAVLQQVTGINVFSYFGPTIFKGLSASTRLDAGLLQAIMITGAGMLFTVIAILTVDRWGRRPLMLAGTVGMCVSLLAMGVLAQFAPNQEAIGHRMLLFILLYIACFGLSAGPVVWVILAEIYPTAIRGRALGLATCFLWIADFLVTYTFAVMDAKDSWFVRHFHHAFPFYVYAFFCVVMYLVVWRYTPETKGRTLEEIEQFWHADRSRGL